MVRAHLRSVAGTTVFAERIVTPKFHKKKFNCGWGKSRWQKVSKLFDKDVWQKVVASTPAKAPNMDENMHLELQELLPLRGLQ